jgi:pyruvate/2-oxoglutarate/acetoin dehydrogenase E1 component
MYGEHTPMRVVIRCPVGGGRGYGPTHSQSVQKHFIGIPHLALFELSPLHDAADVLAAALRRGEPSMLFEDKILYTRRRYADNRVDDRLAFELLGADRNWARVHDPAATAAPVLVIAPGGVADRAIAAATKAWEHGRYVEVLVPARLYPFDVDGVLGLLGGADRVIVAEESTAGGTEVRPRPPDLLGEMRGRDVEGRRRRSCSCARLAPALHAELGFERILVVAVGTPHP